MPDTSQLGHHAGWHHQEHQAESTDSSDTDIAANTESTGSSDTDPATNTNVSGGNPRRTISFTAMAALVQESERLVNASLGRVPQSASNANATVENHGDANSLNFEDRLAILNQHIERFRGLNSVLNDLLEMLTVALQQSNNNNDVTDMRPRLDDLENRINGVMEILQTFDVRLMQLERRMARQTDAAIRLANRVSRTNQRLDRLERRAPEEDDYEDCDYWAQVEEFIRGAVRDAVRDALHGHDALEPPPYGLHPYDPHPYGPHQYGPHPYSLHPVGVPSFVLYPPGMPPPSLIPNEVPRRDPIYRIDRYQFVRPNDHEEATNGQPIDGAATNGQSMDGQPVVGVATNQSADRQARMVVLTIDRGPTRPPYSQPPNSQPPNSRHSHLS